MGHMLDDDEVWIVYKSGDFVALVETEQEAENICSMMSEWWTWKKFNSNNEEGQADE